MKTEADARTMRCCGSEGCGRAAPTVAIDGEVVGHEPRMCAGSACMAWRWAPDETKFSDSSVVKHPHYRVTPMQDSPGHFINEPEGFCGLAGKPE